MTVGAVGVHDQAAERACRRWDEDGRHADAEAAGVRRTFGKNSTTGMITPIIPVVGEAGSVAREFGYSFLGAVIVDERLAGRGRGD